MKLEDDRAQEERMVRGKVGNIRRRWEHKCKPVKSPPSSWWNQQFDAISQINKLHVEGEEIFGRRKLKSRKTENANLNRKSPSLSLFELTDPCNVFYFIISHKIIKLGENRSTLSPTLARQPSAEILHSLVIPLPLSNSSCIYYTQYVVLHYYASYFWRLTLHRVALCLQRAESSPCTLKPPRAQTACQPPFVRSYLLIIFVNVWFLILDVPPSCFSLWVCFTKFGIPLSSGLVDIPLPVHRHILHYVPLSIFIIFLKIK